MFERKVLHGLQKSVHGENWYYSLLQVLHLLRPSYSQHAAGGAEETQMVVGMV